MKIYVDKKANVGRTLSCPDKKRNVQLKTNVIQRYLHAYYLGNKKFNLQGNLQTTKDGKCAYPIEHLDGQGKAFFVAEDLSFAIFGEGYPKTFATNESIRKSNNKLREVDSYVHLKKGQFNN